MPQSGIVSDYGNYTNIQNLSGSEPPSVEGNLITFSAAPGSTFYYRGEMQNAKLPWVFHISYFLGGKQADAQSLIGAAGHLEIAIEAAANPEADPYFGKNYAAQITVSLNDKCCANVVSKRKS